MKKMPYGVSDYERLIEQDYYYVDKTKYIENIENLAEPYIMFLRPRKFGKTLFTSTLENYYDILKVDKFEKLYGETYIGKNSTPLKNSYHILKFNFSGIDTSDVQSTMRGFRNEIASSIDLFVKKYNMDFFVNWEDDAENILNNLIKAFIIQKSEEKIYVIIDEYDHFANELLGFNVSNFKDLVSKNGKVRKWYEILKKGTETVIDRIFITGVAPITLDSLTSGFNISSDITRDEQFNEMMGFTQEELIKIMNNQEISKEKQNELIPIMKENYDGYKFSLEGKEKIYNSNMSLYFLSNYIRLQKMPKNMIDNNIASDYKKLANMLDLCKGEQRQEVIEKVVSGEGIISEITEKFNPAMDFGEKELVSMLFYLGYLTIIKSEFGFIKFGIPNRVMKEIYSDYFLEVLNRNLATSALVNYSDITREIAMNGKIDKFVELVEFYLKNLSNRDFIKFDEKYIKLIFFCISMNLKIFRIKSEMEIEGKYPDLLLIPREKENEYKGVMIEFKYLKKQDADKLKQKQEEARAQIEEYKNFEEIKDLKGISCYTVVAVGDELKIEEV